MSLPRPVAAVVFDMDGLLFDTEKIHAQAALSAAKEIGCAFSMDVFYQLIGTTLQENQRVLLAHYGASYPFEELRVAWGRHFDVLVAAHLRRAQALARAVVREESAVDDVVQEAFMKAYRQ